MKLRHFPLLDREPLALWPFLAPGRRVLVQAPPGFLAKITAGEVDFFEALETLCAARDVDGRLIRLTPANLARAPRSCHLNLLIGAPSTPGRHVLHVCPSYLRGFWYVDPLGERHESSIARASFEAGSVSAPAAGRLFERLSTRLLTNNRTKYDQPERGVVPVPPGCIAVFAQQFGDGARDLRHFTLDAFIEAILRHRGQRPVCIKPHPLQAPDVAQWLRGLHDPVSGVHVLDASVHDLLAAAHVSCSLTSAASFEGFLHKTPAILGGDTDFHHNAWTVRSEAELAEALAHIAQRDFSYERYLFWFLRKNCLAPGHGDFSHRLVERIRATGFDFAPEPVPSGS